MSGPSKDARREVLVAYRNPKFINEARKSLSDMHVDVLVCGKCHNVFHLMEHFKKHKQKPCNDSKRMNSNAQHSSTEIWAFNLWKSSPQTKKDYSETLKSGKAYEEMFGHWSKLDDATRRAWLSAGAVYWELSALANLPLDMEKSQTFDDAYCKRVNKPMLKPVPLATLQERPKRNLSPQVDQDVGKKRLLRDRPGPASKKSKPIEEDRAVSPPTVDEDEDEEVGEETKEFVVEAVVGKRFDQDSMSFLYEIKWEGFPSSENTWEPEENLTHCKAMIGEFEQKRRNRLENKDGKSIRSSKAKALDKVKTWATGGKSNVDEQFDPNMEIKIEEEDPLEPVEENQSNHDSDSIGGDIGADPSYSPENSDNEAENNDEPLAPKKLRGRPRKQTLSIRNVPPNSPSVNVKGRPKKILPNPTLKSTKTVPNKVAAAAPKPDPKTSTLLIANSLGMVRVNAKAIPNMKPGVYPLDKNEQLNRIRPLVPKAKGNRTSGLVVITNKPNVDKPGIRIKPQIRKTPTVATSSTVFAATSPSLAKSPLANSTNFSLSRSPMTIARPGQLLATTPVPASAPPPAQYIVLPPNPGNVPFLVMPPPGSGVGALLVTPEVTQPSTTMATTTATTTPASVVTSVTASTTVTTTKPPVASCTTTTATPLKPDTVKETDKQISSKTEIIKEPGAEENKEEDDVGLAMEVSMCESDSESIASESGKKKSPKKSPEKVPTIKPANETIVGKTAKVVKNVLASAANSNSCSPPPLKTGDEKTASKLKLSEKSESKGTKQDDSKLPKDKKQYPGTSKTQLFKPAVASMTRADINKVTEKSNILESLAEEIDFLGDPIKIPQSSPKSKKPSPKKSLSPLKTPIKLGAQQASISSDTEPFKLLTPTLVEIPADMDPSSVQLPPDTQLMVSESGEYYLVPFTPAEEDGGTLALAEDPSSGEMQLIHLTDDDQPVLSLGK